MSTTRCAGYRLGVVVAAFLGASCGTDRRAPSAPTPVVIVQPPSAIPAPPPGFFWTLHQTQVSITGGDICGWEGSPNLTRIHMLAVRVAGSDLTLEYGPVLDELQLSGRLDGQAFTAATSQPGYQPCRGVTRSYVFEARVQGRFTDDGSALAARETWTYRFESGESTLFTFDWAATRLSYPQR